VRLVLQRVTEAEVRIGPDSVGSVGRGLVVLVGIEPGDGDEDIGWLVGKMTSLKIFDDAEGKMDCSLVDIQGDVLLVSQFTLFASTRKGTRPSWHRAARPEIAQPLYAMLHRRLEERLGKPVPAGVFGADMKVRLVNDGPVTLIIDSKSRE